MEKPLQKTSKSSEEEERKKIKQKNNAGMNV
jgi:hypothetical protein